MEKIMKKSSLLLCFVLAMVSFVPSVKAVKYESTSQCYNYNHSNGSYGGSGCVDHVKKIDGKYAYCSEFGRSITNTSYKIDSSWKTNSKNAIVAGYIIKLVNDKYSGVKGYGITAITLNTYSAKFLKNTRSRGNGYLSNDGKYYDNNSTIKAFIDNAFKEYDNLKLGTTKLPSIKLSASNQVLNYITQSGAYLSEKVTLQSLLATYGGKDDKITYTITPSSTSGKTVICTSSNGTNCKDNVTLEGRSDDYSFYIKATGVKDSDTITVTVKGKNSTKYVSAARYVSNSASQRLMVQVEGSVDRSVTTSINFSVPDLTKHKITGYKVDENGELLKGATLELYKDDVSVASNLLVKNTSGTSTISYTSAVTDVNNDDFFNHNYYLVEKSAPDGYILSSGVNEIPLKGTSSTGNSILCYYNGGNDSSVATPADSERCNFESYVFMCKSSTGEIRPLSEKDNCDFEVSNPTTSDETTTPTDTTDTGTDSGTTTEEGGTGTGTEGGETTETPTEPTPVVTYEKICAKKGSSENEVTEVADGTFCTDKGNYTKIQKTSGNIVVTRSNTKNRVIISKRATTGDDEVEGATLKICTADSYNSKKEECEVTKTIDDVELNWVSGSQPVEFVGLKKGDYYIVEVIPPRGYIKATTATLFSINELGQVQVGDTVLEEGAPIVVHNTLSSISISKQDIATSGELPGATINICLTYVDDDGKVQMEKDQETDECIPAALADGSSATWVSGDKPHEVIGLPAGTYYLVEKIAPDGYATAESILFTLKNDGTLTDENGKAIGDKKLVMHDKKIPDVKTGMLPFYIAIGTVVGVILLGGGSYLYLSKKKGKSFSEIFKLPKKSK